ncbi:MAG: T9SS type A sorting domain-containing protein [Bacteroidota bacterium]
MKIKLKNIFLSNYINRILFRFIFAVGCIAVMAEMTAMAQTRLVLFSPMSGAAVSHGDNISITSLLSQPAAGASYGNGISVQSGFSLYANAANILAGVRVLDQTAPFTFALSQNYPNPFNPSTALAFTLEKTGMTTLIVYDVIGREVETLVSEVLDAGVYHQRTFNASRLASGIYFARLHSGGNVQLKKMLLIK